MNGFDAYLIIYRILDAEHFEVLSVTHGSHDLHALLRSLND